MNKIRLELNNHNQPVVIEMAAPKISRQRRKADAYGRTTSNRLLFSNGSQVACATVDGALDWRELRRLGDRYRSVCPPALRLGAPIHAIHYVQAGKCWPEDQESTPLSIVNCVPDEEWPLLENRPVAADAHALLAEQPDSLTFQCPMTAGQPVVVRYDDVEEVKDLQRQIHLTIRADAAGQLLGFAVLGMRDDKTTVALAEALRNRQVKRLRRNELVAEVFLYPKPARCRGVEQHRVDDQQWSIDHGLEGLWRNAMTVHPKVVAEARCEWGIA
jgi:hypothetical protein